MVTTLTDESLGPDLVGLGSYLAAAYVQPARGLTRGGDRFGLCVNQSGWVFFYLADAPGHGERGAAFWRTHDEGFQRLWVAFTKAQPSPSQIGMFARDVNSLLSAHDDSRPASLCLLFGALSSSGRLLYCNCGYGNHALIATSTGIWWPPQDRQLFGLKLGWVPTATWDAIEGSVVQHEVVGVRRCILFSDGFLGDDHADPPATLEQVRQLSKRCSQVAVNRVIPIFQETPHGVDDATVVLIERA